MIHAGDTVKIKGSHPAHEAMRVVTVDGDGNVATLRYLGGTAEFSEYTRNLYRIACPHADAGRDWSQMAPRDFDTQAADQPLTLFGAPDECGSFDTLF